MRKYVETKEWAWWRGREFYAYIRFLRTQCPGYFDGEWSEMFTDIYFAKRIYKHFTF